MKSHHKSLSDFFRKYFKRSPEVYEYVRSFHPALIKMKNKDLLVAIVRILRTYIRGSYLLSRFNIGIQMKDGIGEWHHLHSVFAQQRCRNAKLFLISLKNDKKVNLI